MICIHECNRIKVLISIFLLRFFGCTNIYVSHLPIHTSKTVGGRKDCASFIPEHEEF